jgi:Spy/CpxP family protein refolding chaperone
MRINMRMTNLIAVVGALLLALAMVASGQGPQGHGGPPGGGFPGGPGPRDGLGPLARDLNLSDEQKAQIQKITESFHESTKALLEQLRTLHESEPDPLAGFDEAAVRAAAEARGKIDVELSVARAKMMSQIGTVLTADQKAQLAAKRQQFERRPPPPPQ